MRDMAAVVWSECSASTGRRVMARSEDGDEKGDGKLNEWRWKWKRWIAEA